MTYLDVALQCVEETTAIFLKGFKAKKEITHKGVVDLVTTVDKAVEDKVIEIIHSEYPDHDILAEESHESERRSSYRWIIDPLDGTTNFAHNVPHFALSIALEHKDELILGLVYQPMSGELFHGEKGKGAFLNDEPIKVSTIPDLPQSLLATGFPYDRHQYTDLYISELKPFMEKVQGIRRAGVASLDLCYVACGRYDGFWERKLKPWDVAASLVILSEAGGQSSQFDGKAYSLKDQTIIASNSLIHREMQEILSPPMT